MKVINEITSAVDQDRVSVCALISQAYAIPATASPADLALDLRENQDIEALGIISNSGAYEGCISRRSWLEESLSGDDNDTLSVYCTDCIEIPADLEPLDVWDKHELDQLHEEIWFAVVDDCQNFRGLFSSSNLLKYLLELSQKDLFLANRIQSRLNVRLCSEKSGGYTIVSKSIPAKDIGGDLVYSRVLKNKNTIFGLFDVSGKGYAAALVTGMLFGVLSVVGSTVSLPKLIKKINAVLCSTFRAELFATAIVGIIDQQRGLIEIADMGHSHCYFVSTGEQIPPEAGNIPLGVDPDLAPKTVEIKLESGDSLAIMSDGFYEQEDSSGKLYDIERVFESIRKTHDVCGVVDDVFSEYNKFIALKSQHDDASIMIVQHA